MNIKKQTNKDDGCGNNMEKFLRTMIGIRIKEIQNDERYSACSLVWPRTEEHITGNFASQIFEKTSKH